MSEPKSHEGTAVPDKLLEGFMRNTVAQVLQLQEKQRAMLEILERIAERGQADAEAIGHLAMILEQLQARDSEATVQLAGSLERLQERVSRIEEAACFDLEQLHERLGRLEAAANV